MRGTHVHNDSLMPKGGGGLCYGEKIYFLNRGTPPKALNVYDLDILLYHCYDGHMDHAKHRLIDILTIFNSVCLFMWVLGI